MRHAGVVLGALFILASAGPAAPTNASADAGGAALPRHGTGVHHARRNVTFQHRWAVRLAPLLSESDCSDVQRGQVNDTTDVPLNSPLASNSSSGLQVARALLNCTCSAAPIACECWSRGHRVYPSPSQTVAEYRMSRETLARRLATPQAFRDLANVHCACRKDKRTGRITGMSPLCSAPFGPSLPNRSVLYWDFACLHVLAPRLVGWPRHFVLITHGRDAGVCSNEVCHQLLRHPRLLAWYGINAISRDVAKVHPIPLHVRATAMGPLVATKRQLMVAPVPPRRLALIQLTYASSAQWCRGREKRRECVRRQIVNALAQGGLQPTAMDRSLPGHWRRMADHRFAISPPGNGVDCFRTWEALYFGAIPVVQTGTLDDLYEGLPVVVIANWSSVTPQFLEAKWQEMVDRKYRWDKLWIYYWVERLLQSTLSS